MSTQAMSTQTIAAKPIVAKTKATKTTAARAIIAGFSVGDYAMTSMKQKNKPHRYSTESPAIYYDVLSDLLTRYVSATLQKDVKEMYQCSMWLESNLPRFDRNDDNIEALLAQIEKVHHQAMDVISKQIEVVKAELESARSTQQRDMAYSVTQNSH